MTIVAVYDAIHQNVDKLPRGAQAAGYTTGTPNIRWTDSDWKAHPGAVRICQDAQASDETADCLDVEAYAATNQEAAGWYRRALSSYASAKRPGQRHPAIYTSASNVTPLANALIAGGVTSGPRLWVAHWGESDAAAKAAVATASGPFPIIGVQNHSFNADDESWMSADWLANVSKAGPFKHQTDGSMSLTAIAHSRRMLVQKWLDEQAAVGGQAVADALGSAVPKAGLTWYSINP